MRPMQWLHNKLWLLPLAGGCSCEYKGKHLVIQGSFTPEYLADFRARCRPSVAAVFGRDPRVGEPVAAFSASYPLASLPPRGCRKLPSQGQTLPRVAWVVACRRSLCLRQDV